MGGNSHEQMSSNATRKKCNQKPPAAGAGRKGTGRVKRKSLLPRSGTSPRLVRYYGSDGAVAVAATTCLAANNTNVRMRLVGVGAAVVVVNLAANKSFWCISEAASPGASRCAIEA